MNRDDLRLYQEVGAEFIIHNFFCALWVGMRLGKSITVLTALSDLFDDFAITRVLVVAPLRVAVSSWPSEFEDWDHIQHMSYQVIRGTPTQRAKQADTYTQISIINKENLPWLVNHHGDDWPYDVVVLDEARAFKGPKKKTPKKNLTRFGAMVKVLPQVDRIIELTGTPMPRGLEDLWGQLYLLDGGERLGRTITAFRDRWFSYHKWTFTYKPTKRAHKEIRKKVSDLTFVLESGDYVDLPEHINSYVEVDMPKKARERYETLEKEFILEFDDGEVDVLSAAGKLNKLLQVSNGAAYIDEDKNWEEYHQEKLKALEEIVEEANGASLLIAYSHIPDKERILKKFPSFKFLDKNPQTIKDWNAGKIHGLVAHPASAGHGLTMWRGGSIIVYFGMTFDLELYDQFNARLDHPDKKEPVNIHHIMCRDTVEQGVVESLQGKSKNQKDLLKEVKKLTQKRRMKHEK